MIQICTHTRHTSDTVQSHALNRHGDANVRTHTHTHAQVNLPSSNQQRYIGQNVSLDLHTMNVSMQLAVFDVIKIGDL